MTTGRSGARRPEISKKAGLAYAFTNEGVELPVIDVTHPEFEVVLGEAEIAVQTSAYQELEKRRARLPLFLRRLMFRYYARKSILLQGMVEARKSFLSGMNTYLLKLGAANLGAAYSRPLDRYVAGSFPALIIRLRTQNTSKLLASGIERGLRAAPSAPLHLVNIAGGPSADSLNALIITRKASPTLLDNRRIVIHVLDLEKDAPDFGRRALESLQAAGSALEGLDIAFIHIAYDWGKPAILRSLLREFGAGPSVAAVSTEGGLFEYGTDSDILSNLEVLRDHAPPGLFVVGSVTRDDDPNRLLHGTNLIPIKPRGLKIFTALVKRAGWSVETAVERPFSDVVRLVRAG
jgi:hypothetical protein